MRSIRLQKILGHASYKTTETTDTTFTPGFMVGATSAREGLGKINAQQRLKLWRLLRRRLLYRK